MAGQGGAEGQQDRAIWRRSHNTCEDPLPGSGALTRQSYVGSLTGTNLRSHSLDFCSLYVLILRHDPPPPQIERPSPHRKAATRAIGLTTTTPSLIPPPNQEMADTLEEAQAAFAKRYEEVRREK
jgi:hypothetical protein